MSPLPLIYIAIKVTSLSLEVWVFWRLCLIGVLVEVVVKVCLSSSMQTLTSVQLIVIVWKPQFKKLGKVMPKEWGLKKAET